MSLIKFPWTNLHEINLDWIIEEVKKCYSPDNPPTNVVLSVNGQTGEVILYPDATVNFPDVSETSWTIGRTTNGTPVGIKFNKTLPLQRVNGNSLFNIYDAGNPPPYPVTSVNGQTGNVVIQVAFTNLSTSSISFITASPDHSWSLDRETVDGAISIKLDTTNDTPSAYLEYVSADETVTETVKLLTLDDIPSSSGVVSVNGNTGVVVLHADDISRTSDNNETVEHCLSSLTTDTQHISSKIGNTSMGTTATTVTGAVAEHEQDISGINSKIGNTSMGTTATTVTGAIKEHSDKIGNTAMGTTADTLTGAIAEHESDIASLTAQLGESRIFRISKTVTIPAGNTTTPGELEVDFANDIGNSSIWAVMCSLNSSILPYVNNAGAVKTWVKLLSGSPTTKILIYNTDTAWTNYTLYTVLICRA